MSIQGDVARENMAKEIVKMIDTKCRQTKNEEAIRLLKELRKEILDLLPRRIGL